MRSSFKCEVIGDENNNIKGIFLESGGCAEHEFGIDDLLKNFEVDESILGVDGSKINKTPKDLVFFNFKKDKIKKAFLGFNCFNMYTDTSNLTELKKGLKELRYLKTKSYDDENEWLSSAWSEHDFAIFASGDEEVAALETIYNAFLKQDIIIFLGSLHPNMPFGRYGLTFLIYSLLDEEYKQSVLNDDLDKLEIDKRAMPILKALEENNCKYYSCTPQWVDESKTQLKFFLNPKNQDINYWGWVVEQDLLDWINDTGVIPNHGRLYEKQNEKEYEVLTKQQFNKSKGLK